MDSVNKKDRLDELKNKALKDDSLPLRQGAKNLVFGSGNPETQVLFLGEGPGYFEDQKGEPFVGNAGLLLNRLLLSIKIPRENVFITNMVMFRPPENRDPTPEEISSFAPYIDGIINTIRPELIVTLGRFSMGKFFPGVYISSIHGKPGKVTWQKQDFIVLPMYHPAAALRNGDILFKLKNDFLQIPQILKKINEEKNVKISMNQKPVEQTVLF